MSPIETSDSTAHQDVDESPGSSHALLQSFRLAETVVFAPPTSRTTHQDMERSPTGPNPNQSTRPAEPQLVRRPVIEPLSPTRSFDLLQQWEGVVEAVDETTFEVRLTDRTDAGHPEESATFPVADVSDSDRELLRPGATFYWSIGYRVSVGGQKTRASEIWFRRLPGWSDSDFQRLKARVAGLMQLLGHD